MRNFLIGLGLGIIDYLTYTELTKERDSSEIREFADKLNIDIIGFQESNEFRDKPRSLWTLLTYRLSLPKQCIENVKSNKSTL